MHPVQWTRCEAECGDRRGWPRRGTRGRVHLSAEVPASVVCQADEDQELDLGFRHTEDPADLHADDSITQRCMARVGMGRRGALSGDHQCELDRPGRGVSCAIPGQPGVQLHEPHVGCAGDHSGVGGVGGC